MYKIKQQTKVIPNFRYFQDKTLKIMHKTFLSRINYILDGRKPNPWGMEIGLSRGTISRLIQGYTPGADSLSIIASNENVNLTWLLQGKGSPFIVERCVTETNAYDFLLAKLKENSDWDFYVMTNGIETHLVLSRMNTYSVRDKIYQYRQVDVFMTYIMDSVLDHIAKYIKQKRVFLLITNRDILKQNYNGELGTFALFGDEKHQGLLSDAVLVTDAKQIKIRPVETPKYNTDLMERATRYVDANYPDLAREDRQQYIAQLYLAAKDKTESSDSLLDKLLQWSETLKKKENGN